MLLLCSAVPQVLGLAGAGNQWQPVQLPYVPAAAVGRLETLTIDVQALVRRPSMVQHMTALTCLHLHMAFEEFRGDNDIGPLLEALSVLPRLRRFTLNPNAAQWISDYFMNMVRLVHWVQQRPLLQFDLDQEDEEFQLPAAAEVVVWDKVE